MQTGGAAGQPARAAIVQAPAMNRPTYAGLLDWNQKEHVKYWEEGVKPSMEDYSMDALSKSSFVLQTKLRVHDCVWSTRNGLGVLDIPKDGDFIPLLDHYGSITIQELQAFVRPWIDANSRAAQDDTMVYEYTRRTLSSEALLRAFQKKDLFHIRKGGGTFPSGVLFLKVVLDESSLSSNATVMKHKKELTRLSTIFADQKWNVPKFNETVKGIELALTQYGSSAPDLLHQLLPAYLECPEPKFRTYIEQKKNAHEDGTAVLTAESLMDFAQAKFLTQRDQDDWNTKAEAEQKDNIFALQTKVKTLTRLVEDTKKALKGKGKGKDNTVKKAKKDRGKPPKTKGEIYERPDGWKWIAPRQGEPTTMELDGKTWHWCAIKTGAPPTGGCNQWTRHHPSDCRGYKYKGTDKKSASRKKKVSFKKSVAKLQAKTAKMDDSDDGYASE